MVRFNLPVLLILVLGQFSMGGPVRGVAHAAKPGIHVRLAVAQRAARTGTVEGRVIYKTDRKRSWRYARYYVKDRRKGFLAEAVVCLKGKSLKKLARPTRSKTTVINQKNLRFVPETIAIRAGDRVKFTNSDPSTHNVSSQGTLHPFDVTMPFGGSATERFNRAGGSRRPIVLGCKFHSQMQAWIYVFDHPFFTVTAADGRYRFTGVPPGTYRIEIMHSAGGLRTSRLVVVRAGQTTTIDLTVSPDNRIKQ